MDMVLGKLDGQSGFADDTFVYGMGEAHHDQHILNVLYTAREENNMRFNPNKCQLKVSKASFFGVIWTPEGIKPDKIKVKAIHAMPFPKNLTELQSFMGMLNYLNRF